MVWWCFSSNHHDWLLQASAIQSFMESLASGVLTPQTAGLEDQNGRPFVAFCRFYHTWDAHNISSYLALFVPNVVSKQARVLVCCFFLLLCVDSQEDAWKPHWHTFYSCCKRLVLEVFQWSTTLGGSLQTQAPVAFGRFSMYIVLCHAEYSPLPLAKKMNRALQMIESLPCHQACSWNNQPLKMFIYIYI